MHSIINIGKHCNWVKQTSNNLAILRTQRNVGDITSEIHINNEENTYSLCVSQVANTDHNMYSVYTKRYFT